MLAIDSNFSNMACIELLRKNGADFSIVDKNGSTLLMLAIGHGRNSYLEYIAKHTPKKLDN
jgi:ankyrin repeat protein